jgi:hypothetical protein
VPALQHHHEYAMTLQARKENYIGPDRTARRIANPEYVNPIAGRTANLIASCTAVHDPSVSVGSVRNVES